MSGVIDLGGNTENELGPAGPPGPPGSSQWTSTGSGGQIYYNDGPIGIGTTSPTNTLDVFSNRNEFTSVQMTNTSGGNLANAGFAVNNDLDNSGYFYITSSVFTLPHFANRVIAEGDADGFDFISATGAADFRFYTGGTDVTNERLRIDSSGNVGIGTRSPQTPLQVGAQSPDMLLNPVVSIFGDRVDTYGLVSANVDLVNSVDSNSFGYSAINYGTYNATCSNSFISTFSFGTEGVYDANAIYSQGDFNIYNNFTLY